jgi:hypothetical protein
MPTTSSPPACWAARASLTRSVSIRPPSSRLPRRPSAWFTRGRTAPAGPAPAAPGSVPAGPVVTGRRACTADRCSAPSYTVMGTRRPALPCASTATTTRHRSPGTRLPRSSGPAPLTRSSASCGDSAGFMAARRPGCGMPRSRSSKPAAPCTCTRWSASTAATPPTRTPSSPRRAGPPPSC